MVPRADRSAGFTLVELILVMLLLASMAAVAAPILSNSLKGRQVEHEAVRFLGLLQHARNEAVASGVPVVVWIDAEAHRMGIKPQNTLAEGRLRLAEYNVHEDITVEVLERFMGGSHDVVVALPGGRFSRESVGLFHFEDSHGNEMFVQRTADGRTYEINKEQRRDLP